MRNMVRSMIHRCAAWGVFALLGGGLVFSLAGSASAEETGDKAADGKLLQAAYAHDAETYQFFADAGHTRKLSREPKPVLHWASPDDWSGDIFVWSDNGRPAIVGCTLSGPRNGGGRMFFHEFHALGTEPLPSQDLPDGKTWAPTTAGLTFMPIDRAPVPGANEKERLTQMRTLAREFAAHTRFGDSDWELRLLTQPMARYQRTKESSSDWLDGAVFTYVLTTGTDAEVLLVLEARKVGDTYRWHSAPARITNRPAWMIHRGKEFWRVDTHTEEAGAITRPYTTFYAGDRTDDDVKAIAAGARTSEPDRKPDAAPLPAPVP